MTLDVCVVKRITFFGRWATTNNNKGQNLQVQVVWAWSQQLAGSWRLLGSSLLDTMKAKPDRSLASPQACSGSFPCLSGRMRASVTSPLITSTHHQEGGGRAVTLSTETLTLTLSASVIPANWNALRWHEIQRAPRHTSHWCSDRERELQTFLQRPDQSELEIFPSSHCRS